MRNRKPYVLTVLRTGGEYKPEHVYRLRDQVGDQAEFVCLSDVPLDGINWIPLRHNWKSWWCKMEMFAPWVEGDFLFMDLDTSVVGDISGMLAANKSTVLKDFYRPDLIGSGLMFWRECDRSQVWNKFIENPAYYIGACTTRNNWGDQGFLQLFADKLDRWQDLTDRVLSYKVHCKDGVPDNAGIICFHGNPRPWQVGF